MGQGLGNDSSARIQSDAQNIGPYRVVRELGRGGMGTVYLCEDTAVGGRPVALKVVHDPWAEGTDLLERFRREIKNLGMLRHPNLVQVLYAGEHEGHPYFVMEYVPGRDLNKWLDEVATLPEPQRIAAIVRVMTKVARGVAHAHQMGTIHRDLKPQNILVRDDGEPMVLDFGIAKHREDTTLTATAAIPGTPSHMAPEQFESDRIEREDLVDVWALGTILYFALTRERPFKGQSLASVSYQIVHGVPASLRKLNPHVPPSLEGLVLSCLEKDPRKRPQSAQDLASRLEALAGEVVGPARRRRRWIAAGIVAAALAATAVGAKPWTWFRAAPAPGPLRPTLVAVGPREIAAADRDVPVASFQPLVRVRLDRPAPNVTLEAALQGPDGVAFERGLLSPAANGEYQASLRVPADRQREGMRVQVAVLVNGEPVAFQAPTLVLDTTPPRVLAALIDARGAERAWPDDAGDILEAAPGTSLRFDARDAGGVKTARFRLGDDPRDRLTFPPTTFPTSVAITGEGTWRAHLAVEDEAGNVTTRTFEVAITGAASRPAPDPLPDSVPAPHGDVPATLVLPDTWGKVTRVGSQTKFDGAASLRPGANKILIDNELEEFDLKWTFRLVDADGVEVATCALAPENTFGVRSETWHTLGARQLGGVITMPETLRGRVLAGEFVVEADGGAPRRQRLRGPHFIEGSLKPRVVLETSRGKLVFELDRTLSPAGVEAFLDRARAGAYDGVAFHEIRKDQFARAGVLDEKGAPRNARDPLPDAWKTPSPTGAKLSVVLVGAAEFQIYLRESASLAMITQAEIGRVIESDDTITALAREAGATTRPSDPPVVSRVVVESW